MTDSGQQERFGDDLVLPEAVGEPGPRVTWHDAESDEEEAAWIARTISELVADGVNPATIAVLSNDRVTRVAVQLHIERRGVPVTAFDGNSFSPLVDLDHPSVKVVTIASAKGLEFPVVFVPAITERLFPSQDSDSESADHARRVLYTALTRAGRRLFVSATRSGQSQLWAELGVEHLMGGEGTND